MSNISKNAKVFFVKKNKYKSKSKEKVKVKK